MKRDIAAIKAIRQSKECTLVEAKRRWVKDELKRRIETAGSLDEVRAVIADLIDELT